MVTLLVCILCLGLSSVVAFSGPQLCIGISTRRPTKRVTATWLFKNTMEIEYQKDCGRGEQHLSASLLEGNIVVYQRGTWLVDSVEVGDGSDPYFSYALIETMQVVWSHNCEHGVLRGLQVEISSGTSAKLIEPLAEIEFGPEQLIAKIPVEWDEATESGKLLVSVRDDMWQPME
jgi:hypothetical protein